MRLGRWFRSDPSASATGPAAARRDRLARYLALATVVCLTAAFVFSAGPAFLMPGPLAGAHASIESCRSCHANSGTGKLSWLKGLAGGDPHADSKACLSCHQMPDTAFNAHGASARALKESTERLVKIAARTPEPAAARAQSLAFPTHEIMEGGVACATCHQEHQGAAFDLKTVSNEQCRSCHVVKFDSFDGQHPAFEAYPFKRRTRIVYDHAGHFGKHFPEVAKKEPGKSIPATCSTCHDSGADRRVMAVQPFDKTCRTCHLDQITGKERVSGPKGIAFLALPGLDVAMLKKKSAAVGEWPEDSDAVLTPFMKVMIGRSERGRALLSRVERLNLQDLSTASDEEIKAVAALAWEIKSLFHALIAGQAKEVLAGLDRGGVTRPIENIVADLTASLPRDVLVRAQQQWLPNLAKELAERPDASERQRSGFYLDMMAPAATRIAFAEAGMSSDAPPPFEIAQAAVGDHGEETIKRRSLPSGTPRSINQDEEAEAEPPARRPKPNPADGSRGNDIAPAGSGAPDSAGADASAALPPSDPADQSDELLSPSEAEQKEIAAREKGAPPQPGGPAPRRRAHLPNLRRRRSDARTLWFRPRSPGWQRAAQSRRNRRPAEMATSTLKTGQSMAAGTGRTTRFSTVPLDTRTGSSRHGYR